MYSRLNPPKPKTHMAKPQYIRQLYDFGYDKDHNLIVVKGEKVNFDKMAAAAAEGCDFNVIKDTLRTGAVRIDRATFENTPGKGAEYGIDDKPSSLIEVAQTAAKAKAAKAEAQKVLDGMPQDMTNGMNLQQFEKFVSEGYLEKYIKQQEAKNALEGEKDAK